MPARVTSTRPLWIDRNLPASRRPPLTRGPVMRLDVSASDRGGSATATHPSSGAGSQLNPYVDYGRWLTAEGGILIIHKDFDLRWRHTLWRLFAWTLSTGGEAWYLLHRSPLRIGALLIACIIAMAAINWVIVKKPVEVYRKVEIRPDCLIIEKKDVFWLQFMDGGWPTFTLSTDGSWILGGIYGTRFVEYLIIRNFDEFDRGADVFKAHLQDAMQQLWTRQGKVAPPYKRA